MKLQTFKEFSALYETNNIPKVIVQNKHSTHLEDLILDGGKKATNQVLDSLSTIGDKFTSTTKSKDIGVSVKYDGAPAVFFGHDPENGKFFVGTKAIFNKVPKINYTDEDIEGNHVGVLADKLKTALKYLAPITPNKGEVFQGDLMFTSGDLKTITANNIKYNSCHPNTIVYATPIDSKLSKQWNTAKIGIVMHTRYQGGNIATMQATFGVSASEFGSSKDAWIEDAYYKSYDGVVTFTQEESKLYNKTLKNAVKLANNISSSTYSSLQGSANKIINTYNNTFIRNNSRVDNKVKAKGLVDYVNIKYQKEIDKRKSDKGKQTQIDARDKLLKSLPSDKELTNVYELQNNVVFLKNMVMAKLDQVSSMSTFVVTSSGEIKVTGAEGYVGLTGSDIPSGVKLVDRYEFSFNNFSPEIKKGWTK